MVAKVMSMNYLWLLRVAKVIENHKYRKVAVRSYKVHKIEKQNKKRGRREDEKE
ncbi:hypothetical protein FACS1894132_02570 [Clostridia bacterium]|nr:hypothetical protein FACS1894132_02570 [Clostridia bacterium]